VRNAREDNKRKKEVEIYKKDSNKSKQSIQNVKEANESMRVKKSVEKNKEEKYERGSCRSRKGIKGNEEG
jgi:hypothetical protein